MTTAKITRLALAIAFVLIAATSVAAQTQGLNGTWKLNLAKSDFGSDTPPKSMIVTVMVREPNLHLAVAEITADNKERKYTIALTTDGRPVLSPNGKASDSASWDGETLVLEHNEPHYTLTRRISVVGDGYTAISRDVFKMTNGQELVITEVFDRQP